MFKPLSNARIDIEQWLSWVKLVNHQKTTKSFTRKKKIKKIGVGLRGDVCVFWFVVIRCSLDFCFCLYSFL